MKAISTRYLGPTNFKGSRIVASDGDGNRIVVSLDSALGSEENHEAAAAKLCEKMGWAWKLESGWLRAGEYVHVFVGKKGRAK